MNRLTGILRSLVITLAACFIQAASAGESADSIRYSIEAAVNGSTGRLAPYMIGSWNADRSTMKSGAVADFAVEKLMSQRGRFSWGFGAEMLTAYQHAVDFNKYDAHDLSWYTESMRPAAVSLRRFYGEIRYRGLTLSAGLKGFCSKIVDERLSSGDLVRSNNARNIPGVTLGFVDFQDIPFTKGWLQIDGQIMYGKFTDNSFRRKQYNYYSDLIATDLYYTYKYCYFRTKPSERFSATFGMQAAGQFGGKTDYYQQGYLRKSENRGFRIQDALKMFFPTVNNGNGFYEGNSLGSWALRARYRLNDGGEIAAYWEKFFEDGSGIACRNGFDGLYGLQYSPTQLPILKSVVVEYLDFVNQSGPLHYAPGDRPGPSISTEATGGDNYYNNGTYGAYVNYGMAIGSPMVVAPIYNENGFPQFIYNRMRGCHIAAMGSVVPTVDYKVMFSWQKGYAMGRVPLPQAKTDLSAMAEVVWSADRLAKGLSFDCRVAIDRGELRGDNFGFALAVRYAGQLSLEKK